MLTTEHIASSARPETTDHATSHVPGKTTEHITSNARDNTALTYLQVGLDEALATGQPAAVRWIPTSHTDRQFVELATGLVLHRGVNVLVLGGGPVTFVPLR